MTIGRMIKVANALTTMVTATSHPIFMIGLKFESINTMNPAATDTALKKIGRPVLWSLVPVPLPRYL